LQGAPGLGCDGGPARLTGSPEQYHHAISLFRITDLESSRDGGEEHLGIIPRLALRLCPHPNAIGHSTGRRSAPLQQVRFGQLFQRRIKPAWAMQMQGVLAFSPPASQSATRHSACVIG